MAEGFRHRSSLAGCASDVVEDEHTDGNAEKAVAEVGFASDTLTTLGEQHIDTGHAIKSPSYPFETRVLPHSVFIEGLGTLTHSICYEHEAWSGEKVARVFTRLKFDGGASLWIARDWARFHLALIDFLGGASAGNFQCAIRAGRAVDARLRLGCYPRKKADNRFDIRLSVETPIEVVPNALDRAWQCESMKKRIFAITTLRSASLGVIEKFLRAMGVVEQFLRARYSEYIIEEQRNRYKNGLAAYNRFCEQAPSDVAAFMQEFAVPRCPESPRLRDLLSAAFDECEPFGLPSDRRTAREIVDLRNQLAHGDEQSDQEWFRSILVATDVALAMLELLTAKDLRFHPPADYRPRKDCIGYQSGSYEHREL